MKSCTECQYSKKYYPDGDTSDPLFSLECELAGEDLGYGDNFPVPPLCPRTKEGCLHHHKKMWNWIADEIERRNSTKVSKRDYLRSVGVDPNKLIDLCYLCMYAHNQYNGYLCNNCLIQHWPGKTCTEKDSYWKQFMYARTPKEAAHWARKVASLADIRDTNYKQIIIARKDLDMSPGKLSAQVSHASRAFLVQCIKAHSNYDDECYDIRFKMRRNIMDEWLMGTQTTVVLKAKSKDHLLKSVEESGLKEGRDYFPIYDKCYTELTPEENDGTTLTAIGFRPMPADVIDPITRKYQLYK